jgi:hypothetical protein
MTSEGDVALILAYTLATGLNVVHRLYFTAYATYRRRHGDHLLGYIAGFPNEVRVYARGAFYPASPPVPQPYQASTRRAFRYAFCLNPCRY